MVSSSKTVVALSGFLGRSQDWDADLLPPGWSLEAPDVLDVDRIHEYDEWARRFVRVVPRGSVLLGYSMGGRLAMHALIAKPDHFAGAMIVSANPGLVSSDERRLRVQADEIWAQKFMHEPWAELMTEWNAQAALRPPRSGHVSPLERLEKDFDRAALARALRTWSLGAQRDLRSELGALQIPVEFVTGRDDVKFTAIAREVAARPAQGERKHVIVDDAGHRVPWDAPNQFRAVLADFLAHW